MKRLIALFALTATLAACGGPQLTVIDSETLAERPELKDLVQDWQRMHNAALAEDCEGFLTYTRKSLNLTEDDCGAAFEYFGQDAPEIDWERTEFNESAGKAKVYELNQGSLTTLILNTATDVWGVEEAFWL